MPTAAQIQQTILNGEYSLGTLLNNSLSNINSGGLAQRPAFLQWYRLNLQALIDQQSIGDYTSNTTQTIYDRINGFIGIPYGATLNPNFQQPTQKIIVNQVTAGWASTIFYFTNQAPVTIANYNLIYQPIYGKTPGVTIFLISPSQEDEQTPPTFVYSTPGDPTSDLLSIVWDYPVGVGQTGYVIITGSSPVSGSPSSGPAGSTPYTFTQAALVFDGVDYYLPLALPAGKNPIFISSNGVQVNGLTYDNSVSPARLDGFANNLTQTIIVYVI